MTTTYNTPAAPVPSGVPEPSPAVIGAHISEPARFPNTQDEINYLMGRRPTVDAFSWTRDELAALLEMVTEPRYTNWFTSENVAESLRHILRGPKAVGA